VSLVPVLATGAVALVGGLYGLWMYPLGLPEMSYPSALAALLVTGFVVGRQRTIAHAAAPGIGAFLGLAAAWLITVAIEPREVGEASLLSLSSVRVLR